MFSHDMTFKMQKRQKLFYDLYYDMSQNLLADVPGASCSKLTTSLVNNLLKFQTGILQIHCYFLLIKCENPLPCKGFSHFTNKK